MKLAILVGLAAAALSAPMPQSREPQPFPARISRDFFQYLGRYQKIFANPANHKGLQQLFASPAMRRMIFGLLHKQPPTAFGRNLRTDWTDKSMTRDEFMAWYPHLVVIFKRFGAKPALREEWRVADTDGKGLITPIKLWTMLRDANTNKFFTSFLSLLYSEWQKTYNGKRGRRSFFNRFKKAAFEKDFDGLFGKIAAMRPVSDKQIKQMAETVEKTQGKEAADEFMENMGMGKGDEEDPETIAVMPKTADADEKPAKIAVEEQPGAMTDAEEPFVAANEKVTAENGQTMTAAQMVASDMEPMPNTPVTVTMPTGNKVDLMTAPAGAAADNEEQPQAEITNTATGETVAMPVVSMENDGEIATTEVMTDSGSTAELKMSSPTAADAAFAGAGLEMPVKITDTATNAEADAIATPTSNATLSDELCEGAEEPCVVMDVVAANLNMSVPFAMGPQTAADEPMGEAMGAEPATSVTVINKQTGAQTDLDNVKIEEEAGDIKVTATSADGLTKMEVILPKEESALPDGMSSDTLTEEEKKGAAIVTSADGQTLAEGKIEEVTTEQDSGPAGKDTIKVEAEIAGTPTEMIISGPDLAELPIKTNETIEMTVSMDGGLTEIPLENVQEDEAAGTITGETASGTEITVPAPDKVAPADGNPATSNDVIGIQSPKLQKEEVVAIKNVATDGEDKEIITAQTPQGQTMTIKVDKN